jgi:hypothetical protein
MRRGPYSDLPVVPDFELKSNIVATDHSLPPAQVSGISERAAKTLRPTLNGQVFPSRRGASWSRCSILTHRRPAGSGTGPLMNLPAQFTSLPTGAGNNDETLPIGAVHLPNDARLQRHLGAAPPPGDPPHRYFMVVSALDIAETGLPTNSTAALASFQMLAHTIARGRLIPIFGMD